MQLKVIVLLWLFMQEAYFSQVFWDHYSRTYSRIRVILRELSSPKRIEGTMKTKGSMNFFQVPVTCNNVRVWPHFLWITACKLIKGDLRTLSVAEIESYMENSKPALCQYHSLFLLLVTFCFVSANLYYQVSSIGITSREMLKFF